MLSRRQIERLRHASAAQGGVLATSDLAVLFDRSDPPRLGEAIQALVRHDLLARVRRGLYVDRLHGYQAEVLGQRWVAPSYLSTESALDRHELCQTGIAAHTYVTTRLLPTRAQAIRVFDEHRFVYRHVRPHLFFGFGPSDGVWIADPEKAVIDFLYFVQKGQRSVLAPDDIAADDLDLSRFRRYLNRYKQRGFQKYALAWVGKRGTRRARRQRPARA